MGRTEKVRYRELRRVCGDYLYVYVYPVFPSANAPAKGSGRRKKYKETSEVQQKLNDRHSKEHFEMLVHANCTQNDYVMHLSYEDGWLAENDEQADRDLSAYLRRIKRLYQKAGIESWYIGVTAKGSERGRYHHHIFLPGGIDRSLLEDKWHFGYANCDRLQFNEQGIADLADYVVEKQDRVTVRRWRASRNIKKPIEKPTRDYVYDRRRALSMTSPVTAADNTAALYPGYIMSEDPYIQENELNGGVYLSMKFYREDADFMQRRHANGKYKDQRRTKRGELKGA